MRVGPHKEKHSKRSHTASEAPYNEGTPQQQQEQHKQQQHTSQQEQQQQASQQQQQKEKQTKWNLGDIVIDECTSYRYLGDEITNDGKNAKNIEARKTKVNASTININTIATGEILSRIESCVLLELHEKINISSLLSNAESWTLNKGDMKDIEQIEIQALKNLFDLPIHIPTPALHYTLGTLYTKSRVDQRRLNYLHKLLCKDSSQWPRKTLQILEDLDIGWSRGIKSTLTEYNLPTDFQIIKSIHSNEWKAKVRTEIETNNTKRLIKDCQKTTDGMQTTKTKTAKIYDEIVKRTYKRNTREEILKSTKYEAKTIMIARFGMLECGKNNKGTMKETCDQCYCQDNETHRLNYCPKWRDINFYDCTEKADFELIYSSDIVTLSNICEKISKVWNTKSAHGTMNHN